MLCGEPSSAMWLGRRGGGGGGEGGKHHMWGEGKKEASVVRVLWQIVIQLCVLLWGCVQFLCVVLGASHHDVVDPAQKSVYP